MRFHYLLQALTAFHAIQALPHGAPDADDYSLKINSTDASIHLDSRAFGPAVLLGQLAQDLLLNTVTGGFAGYFLNSAGGSSNVVNLSEQTLERIATLVRRTIDDAWYERDKADGRTFLQIAGNYARRGAYNQTHPDPAQFSIIDQDRELAHDYAIIAQGLLNRISLYRLKGAPLYQVIVGTWVSFRREQIVLSQLLDDINHGSTTLASSARNSFRSDCRAMRDALIDYRDEYDHRVPPLYFNIREFSDVVSSHFINCRQTVERWVSMRAYKQAMYSDADRANVTAKMDLQAIVRWGHLKAAA
ncbi:hypothetical protein S40288_11197 [Stachybotrys chartarum IBT 40288]|nr:hypothetical protein S40288_11197 [Stachybotrys chartarum IBT 40288]